MKDASVQIKVGAGLTDTPHTTLTLEGNLSVKNAAALAAQIQTAIAETTTTDCYVQVSNVTQLDLSGIQLLYALKQTFATKAVNLSIDLELPLALAAIIKNAGFGALLKPNP